MIYFGCLPLVILVIAFSILIALLNTGLRLVNKLGATAIWLWDSFLNIFRSEKKEVINPWTNKSSFDDPRQDNDIQYHPTESRPKRYESTDGEYIDYTDIK